MFIMGSSVSLHTALDKVATKTKWKKGLIVNVRGYGLLRVIDIKPINGTANAVNANTVNANAVNANAVNANAILYIYHGNNIITDVPSDGYAIALQPIKTGGKPKHHHYITTPRAEQFMKELGETPSHENFDYSYLHI